jgi:hypothetical protein
MPRGLGIWLGIVVAFGCSSNDVAPLEGLVTLDGQPLPRVAVMLVPEGDDTRPFRYTSNNEGVFQLADGEGRTLPVGRYKVVVVGTPVPKAPRIPAVYAAPNTTPALVEITSASRRIEVLLRSK